MEVKCYKMLSLLSLSLSLPISLFVAQVLEDVAPQPSLSVCSHAIGQCYHGDPICVPRPPFVVLARRGLQGQPWWGVGDGDSFVMIWNSKQCSFLSILRQIMSIHQSACVKM